MAATPTRIQGEGIVHIEPGALEAFRAEREGYVVLGPFRGLKAFREWRRRCGEARIFQRVRCFLGFHAWKPGTWADGSVQEFCACCPTLRFSEMRNGREVRTCHYYEPEPREVMW